MKSEAKRERETGEEKKRAKEVVAGAGDERVFASVARFARFSTVRPCTSYTMVRYTMLLSLGHSLVVTHNNNSGIFFYHSLW